MMKEYLKKHVYIIRSSCEKNKAEFLAVAFGLMLCIASFLGMVSIKGYTFTGQYDFDSFITEVMRDHLTVKAEIDCPSVVTPKVHITLQNHDEVWGSIYLNSEAANFEECKAIMLSIESESGTPEVFDIQNSRENAFSPKWLKNSAIETKPGSLLVSVEPKDFIGNMGFRVTGVQNNLSYSKHELTIISSLKNAENIIISPIHLMTQKRQSLLSTIPTPDEESTLGIMNGYEFKGNSGINEFNNIVYVQYEDEESKDTEELLLIILSALIGIGAAGIFQGVINYYSK